MAVGPNETEKVDAIDRWNYALSNFREAPKANVCNDLAKVYKRINHVEASMEKMSNQMLADASHHNTKTKALKEAVEVCFDSIKSHQELIDSLRNQIAAWNKEDKPRLARFWAWVQDRTSGMLSWR
jgi:uncharacterized protein YydD (DUF2326 family)